MVYNPGYKYTFSRSGMVKPHAKSIVLGGGVTLFPIPEGESEQMAALIRRVIEEAEKIAYARGYGDAQQEMRRALGVPDNLD